MKLRWIFSLHVGWFCAFLFEHQSFSPPRFRSHALGHHRSRGAPLIGRSVLAHDWQNIISLVPRWGLVGIRIVLLEDTFPSAFEYINLFDLDFESLTLIWHVGLDRLFIGRCKDPRAAGALNWFASFNSQQERETGNIDLTFWRKKKIQSSDRADYPCVDLVIWWLCEEQPASEEERRKSQ